MKQSLLQALLLAAGLALLVVIALAGESRTPVSVPSTYDAGPHGYEALYNVLRAEAVPVERLRVPFALRNPKARVLAFSSGASYDAVELERLTAFQRTGGTIVYFGRASDAIVKRLQRKKLHVTVLPRARFTNRALWLHPANVRLAYDTLAGRGLVLFDERPYGYGNGRSLWSVLPQPVRIAFWIALVALGVVILDGNTGLAPPIPPEPPAERDSGAYVASMASLLRRAHAGRAAIARFAEAFPDDAELAMLAAHPHPSESSLLRAAKLFHRHRKDGL